MTSGGAGKIGALHNQMLELLHRHPPHKWSADLLTAVVAVIGLEAATKHPRDEVSRSA